MSPTTITHASTGPSPMSRVDRDEQTVAVAHANAAPSPPRIASIPGCLSRRAGPAGRGPEPGRGSTARGAGVDPTPTGRVDPAAGHGSASWARGASDVTLDRVIPSRPQEPLMTALDARIELQRLQAERLDAA